MYSSTQYSTAAYPPRATPQLSIRVVFCPMQGIFLPNAGKKKSDQITERTAFGSN